MKQRKAFTLVELIFVIVILGILAAVAIPRMAGGIIEANIGKAKSDVAALRSAIASERQGRFLRGISGYITTLDKNDTGVWTDQATVFDDNDTNVNNGKLMTYGVTTGSNEGQWQKVGDNQYRFYSDGAAATFTYTPTDGRFMCTVGADVNGTLCRRIIN